MDTATRIKTGELPSCLSRPDYKLYRGTSTYIPNWEGFCHAWGGIMWVRYQGFERDLENEAAAEDWQF